MPPSTAAPSTAISAVTATRGRAPRSITTRTGARTLTRPAGEGDFHTINELHWRCTLDTRFARYQAARRELRPAEWRHLIRPDRATTWITYPEDQPGRAVALTHLIRTAEPEVFELSLLVEDEWQSQGLGAGLAGHAIGHARSLGGRAVVADVRAGNARMVAILLRLGATVRPPVGNFLSAEIRLRP